MEKYNPQSNGQKRRQKCTNAELHHVPGDDARHIDPEIQSRDHGRTQKQNCLPTRLPDRLHKGDEPGKAEDKGNPNS